MPRPHSPTCLLWAKNLKDEHTKLKARTYTLEQADTKRSNDSEVLNHTGATVKEIVSSLAAVTERITELETNHHQHESDASINAIQNQLAQIDKRLEIQSDKIVSLERTNTELKEDCEHTGQLYEELMQRFKTAQEAMDKLLHMSPGMPKKNDPSSTKALSHMIENIQSKQWSDHQTLQRLHTQVQWFTGLMANQALPTGLNTQVRTPNAHEVSSPVVHVVSSPLVERQERAAEQASSSRQAMAPLPATTDNQSTGRSTTTRTVTKSRKGHSSKLSSPKILAARTTMSTMEGLSSPAKSAKQRKAASSPTIRQTRSRTKINDQKFQTRVASKHASLNHSATTSNHRGSNVAIEPHAVHDRQKASERVQDGDSKTVIAYSRRKRRPIPKPLELPPLEEMSD